MPHPDTPPPTPYAAHAHAYRAAGWDGVLPLPAGQKHPVPRGFTGNQGIWPSGADIQAWADGPEGAGNIALRLPEDIIGLDVDNYDGKPGAATLHLAETQHGPLPATWRTTSRDDGISGIRLYRIPTGRVWPNTIGPGIDTIRYAHRYAVAPPSTHPNGGTYRWINPDSITALHELPQPDQLPHLPQAWVDAYSRPDDGTSHTPSDLSTTEATSWLAARPTGTPCPAVQRTLDQRAAELTHPGHGARHDIALEATQRIAHLAAEGHPGTLDALAQLRTVFLTTVTADHTRSAHEAELEWERMLAGAIRNAHPTTADDSAGDPCANPFHGLIDRAPASPADLIRNTTPATQEPPCPPANAATTETSTSTESPEATTSSNPAPDASASTTGPPGTAPDPDDADEGPPPSWRPINLTPYLDGTWTPDTPTLLTRTDGQPLIYPGKVHDFHGESESGKSLVAQILTADLLQQNRPILYIDFEDDAGPITRRLILLGATPDQITRHLTYVRPEASPYAIAEASEWAALLNNTYELVIVDGVTDALGQFGGASKDNDDIATWHRMVPRMLTRRTHAAVILIDHVIKNTDTRGRFAIGGQAKMAAIDGASYSVEIKEPIGKGMSGTVTLRIGKDRPGEIRAHCGKYRATDRTQEAAQVHIDSTNTDQLIRVSIDPPEDNVTDHHHSDDDKPFKPTAVMEKLSRILERRGEPMSLRQLHTAFKDDGGRARQSMVTDAINLLVDAAHFTEEQGPNRSRLFTSINVYRQRTDPEADAYVPPLDGLIAPSDEPPHPGVSRCVPVSPGHTEVGVSVRVPPVGDTDTLTGHTTHPVSPPNRDTPSTTPPAGEGWTLNYELGEYVNITTGEIWDGGGAS
ncbi:bifunctional DNA primase/polymerase [Ruania rhizosphaerae]|uniref:bifunctional DNA primase/polymerase n=1 Tax=Ruania rhizosphaerae TaxID=1840413 RepID=UPI001F49008A|nr:bifunctional DNA primase/polymerase [Ruania rhizosphaerae]